MSKENRREKGTGGITQRKDGLYQGRFDAGVKPDGKRDVRYVYAKTEPECKRKLNALIKEIHKTEYVYVQKESVKEFLTMWLTAVKVLDLKPKSYDRLEQTINNQVIPYIGDKQIHDLKSDEIQEMISKLVAEGKSYSSIKKAYEALNALECCVQVGINL